MTVIAQAATATTQNATNLLNLSGESTEAATEQLLAHATRLHASDMFFCTNEQHVLVQVRHLGVVRPVAVLPKEQGKRVITLVKTRALLDLAERRRPQEGRWIHEVANNNGAPTIYDVRVSLIPTIFGEDLALRLLDRTSKLYTLEGLGLTRQQRNLLTTSLDAPGGLVLLTGPTGSGKTATLYACMQRINAADKGSSGAGKKRINTIEDPIESL